VTALIVGGVVVGIVVLVLALTSLGGGGGSGKGANAGSTSTNVTHTRTTHHAATGGGSSSGESTAGSPASTSVAVLNGTGTAGLAHRLSGTLRQSGYGRATALNGRPAGVHQVTVVEYSSGHRGDAEGVARSLGVTQVQPMEAATTSLAGASTVAVIAGADKATGP
jgi:hypothetical protein